MHPYPTSESAKSTLLCAFGLGLNPFRSCLVLFDRILCPPSLTMAKPSGGSSSRFADAGRNRYDRIRQPIPAASPIPTMNPSLLDAARDSASRPSHQVVRHDSRIGSDPSIFVELSRYCRVLGLRPWAKLQRPFRYWRSGLNK
jgi:hypothetical protein